MMGAISQTINFLTPAAGPNEILDPEKEKHPAKTIEPEKEKHPTIDTGKLVRFNVPDDMPSKGDTKEKRSRKRKATSAPTKVTPEGVPTPIRVFEELPNKLSDWTINTDALAHQHGLIPGNDMCDYLRGTDELFLFGESTIYLCHTKGDVTLTQTQIPI